MCQFGETGLRPLNGQLCRQWICVYFGGGTQPMPPVPSASATADDDTAGEFSAIPAQYIYMDNNPCLL